MADDTEERAEEEAEKAEQEEAEELLAEEAAGEVGEEGEQEAPDIHQVVRYCLGLVIHQAWVHLGLRAATGTVQTRMDLPLARMAIDVAAILHEQIKPTAAAEEQRAVDRELANLRINYAQRAEKA
jgi:hypothetical protein